MVHLNKNLPYSSLLKGAAKRLTVRVRHKLTQLQKIHFNSNIDKSFDYKVFEFRTILKPCYIMRYFIANKKFAVTKVPIELCHK